MSWKGELVTQEEPGWKAVGQRNLGEAEGTAGILPFPSSRMECWVSFAGVQHPCRQPFSPSQLGGASLPEGAPLHQLLSERPSATVPFTTSFPARLPDYCVIHRPTACISPALAPHTGTSLGATPEISYHNAIFFLLLLFSHPVIAGSLQPHGLQHSRPPCPSPSPRVCPSPRSLHQWCHPAISSSDTLFSFCPQPFPASETGKEQMTF